MLPFQTGGMSRYLTGIGSYNNVVISEGLTQN
uniref:Uncharacterized protein n=1 Tax=Anguilla anguilla TaxID=7936 RepID=A0A0E9S7T0_ANGAN